MSSNILIKENDILGEQNEKGGEKEIEQIEENVEKAISPAVDIIGIEETSAVIDGLESDGTLDIRSGFDDYDERDSREGKAIDSQKETIEGVAINKENTINNTHLDKQNHTKMERSTLGHKFFDVYLDSLAPLQFVLDIDMIRHIWYFRHVMHDDKLRSI